jgi:saccharopine dehydrogenase (NADP+, L-glutamate forming)
MGMLDDSTKDYLTDASPLSWKDLAAKVLGSSSTAYNDLVWSIESKTTFKDTATKNRIVEGLRWIGLFDDTPVTKRGTVLDTLCASLEQKMEFGAGERDLVFLQHRFDIEWKDGRKETMTSTLVENGDPTGYSAMAKTVGVPCGVATLLVLDGTINRKGVLAPMDPELTTPVMNVLKEKYGIFLVEKSV